MVTRLLPLWEGLWPVLPWQLVVHLSVETRLLICPALHYHDEWPISRIKSMN
jgi:hypothetical protein